MGICTAVVKSRDLSELWVDRNDARVDDSRLVSRGTSELSDVWKFDSRKDSLDDESTKFGIDKAKSDARPIGR